MRPHHETPDDAELRRLAENATPGPWGSDGLEGTLDSLSAGRRVAEVTMWREVDAMFIAAASPATVLGLLDRLAHMTEARDNARAEVERLTGQVEAVREWVDRRGVNVGDRDDDYMRGYRDAQRHAVQDAAELRATLDRGPRPTSEEKNQ